MKLDIYDLLIATYTAVGQEVPDIAVKTVAADLQAYSIEEIAFSLTRCRKELRKIALVDILERIPNGHPSADEAWSIVYPALKSEKVTIIWTQPMAAAFRPALNLRDDPIASRMAFKETYQRLVAIARTQNERPKWEPALGFDANQRADAIKQGISEGKLLEGPSMKYLTETIEAQEQGYDIVNEARKIPRKMII